MFDFTMDGDVGFEVSLAGVLNNLVQAGGDDLHITVSSNGGDVKEGTGIYNALFNYMKANSAKVTFEILGWAQSAMSYITTLPGATVIVHPNSLYMYHNPMTVAVGDSTEFARQAQFLDALTSAYAASYSQKSGIKIDDIKTQMSEETILVGQEIIDAGFADEMIQDSVIDAAAIGGVNAVEMSKKNYSKTYSRLCAVAYGIETIDSNLTENNLQNGVIKMADQKKTPEEIAIENKRVEALANAIAAIPANTKQFQTYFAEGKSADFFEGLVAVHEADKVAKAEAKKKENGAGDAAAAEGARATAFASAVKVMPLQVEMLQKHFADGASADLFKGIQAQFEATVEMKKIEDAEGESPDDVDNPEPKVKGGASAKSFGETGQTVKA